MEPTDLNVEGLTDRQLSSLYEEAARAVMENHPQSIEYQYGLAIGVRVAQEQERRSGRQLNAGREAMTEPIIKARHHGMGKQIRVYPNRVEIEKVFGGTQTIPMRQIHDVKVSWRGKLTLKTSTGDHELEILEFAEVAQAIRENM